MSWCSCDESPEFFKLRVPLHCGHVSESSLDELQAKFCIDYEASDRLGESNGIRLGHRQFSPSRSSQDVAEFALVTAAARAARYSNG